MRRVFPLYLRNLVETSFARAYGIITRSSTGISIIRLIMIHTRTFVNRH